jgi:hypothetical protein
MAGGKGRRATLAWWPIAVLVSCVAGAACGGRAVIGSLPACADPDSGAESSVESDGLACSPAPCSVIGAWQPGGGEIMCTGPTCNQVVPACAPGAIRFDPSGALFRLTSAGWESACGYATCGERVTGAQLSNIVTANYAAMPGSSRTCGPDWDVFVVGESFDAGSTNVTTCSLQMYAPCAGVQGPRTDGPPGVAPWDVELAYSQCTP